jgi:uncharacterized protein
MDDREMAQWTNPCYILSVDGGGMRGIFPAALIKNISHDFPIMREMSLLAGTSTGAIITVALALSLSPEAILSLYLHLGQEVFRKKGTVKQFCGYPAYLGTTLRKTLEAIPELHNKRFGECRPRTLVPAICQNTHELVVFDSDNPQWFDTPAVEIIMASTAAPFYFPPHQIGDRLFVDGGLACNNPAMVAMQCAIEKMGVRSDMVRMLSIGTGQFPTTNPMVKSPHVWPWVRAKQIIEICMQTSSERAAAECGRVLGGSSHYLRVSPVLGQEIHLDDYGLCRDVLLPLAESQVTGLQAILPGWLTY